MAADILQLSATNCSVGSLVKSGVRKSVRTNNNKETPFQKGVTVGQSQNSRDDKHKKPPAQTNEAVFSQRDLWWRHTLKDTPVPGTYECITFLDEIDRQKMSYNFKSLGRKKSASAVHNGALLLPGAYKIPDLVSELDRKRQTYSFKSSRRQPTDIFKYGVPKDKDVNISPDAYHTETYLAVKKDEKPHSQWFFKSESKRQAKPFLPRDGPGPGNYEMQYSKSENTMRSPFISRTPRFTTSYTKVPGPGSYHRTYPYLTRPSMDDTAYIQSILPMY